MILDVPYKAGDYPTASSEEKEEVRILYRKVLNQKKADDPSLDLPRMMNVTLEQFENFMNDSTSPPYTDLTVRRIIHGVNTYFDVKAFYEEVIDRREKENTAAVLASEEEEDRDEVRKPVSSIVGDPVEEYFDKIQATYVRGMELVAGFVSLRTYYLQTEMMTRANPETKGAKIKAANLPWRRFVPTNISEKLRELDEALDGIMADLLLNPALMKPGVIQRLSSILPAMTRIQELFIKIANFSSAASMKMQINRNVNAEDLPWDMLIMDDTNESGSTSTGGKNKKGQPGRKYAKMGVSC